MNIYLIVVLLIENRLSCVNFTRKVLLFKINILPLSRVVITQYEYG